MFLIEIVIAHCWACEKNSSLTPFFWGNWNLSFRPFVELTKFFMLALSLQIMMPRETKHYMPCDVPFLQEKSRKKSCKVVPWVPNNRNFN